MVSIICRLLFAISSSLEAYDVVGCCSAGGACSAKKCQPYETGRNELQVFHVVLSRTVARKTHSHFQ